MEDLEHLAPTIAGLAEATRCAPERKASPLPSPGIEADDRKAILAPQINVEDVSRPQSPETIIPASQTLSTRPTRGGIAYPFRLKVDGEEQDANASTLTLQSVSVDPERPALTDERTLGGSLNEDNAPAEAKEDAVDRPGVERFVTADVGELKTEEQRQDEKTTDERPGVERFETAKEELGSPAHGAAF